MNFQRTYEPLAAMVKEELNAGTRIAMAGRHERDLGALMFYLDSRLEVISLENDGECAGFLYSRPGPAGIVVAESDFIRVGRQLTGNFFRSIQSACRGHKSSEFWLFVNYVLK